MDVNGDGWIDLKKFNSALRSSTIPKAQHLDLSKLEGSAIEHETKHQSSLCTCHNTYRISKISGNMYKVNSFNFVLNTRIHSSVLNI